MAMPLLRLLCYALASAVHYYLVVNRIWKNPVQTLQVKIDGLAGHYVSFHNILHFFFTTVLLQTCFGFNGKFTQGRYATDFPCGFAH